MRRALIGLGILAVVAAAVGVGTVALADFTPPAKLSSGVQVESIHFTFIGTGASTVIVSEVCGSTTVTGGVREPSTCRGIGDIPAGALRTSVLNLRTGDALTFWRGLYPGL